MHELAICQSLMNQVESIVVERGARSVSSITVALGPLSGIETELLMNVYPMASAGTVASNAKLIINNLPIRVRCSQCNCESEASANKLVCKACGDWRTTLISGDEMMLMSLELETYDKLSKETLSDACH